jgi:hypothetical protein
MEASVTTTGGMPNLTATYYGAKRKKMAGSHPGFKAVQGKIAGKYGMRAAGAILASATRKASKKAKKKNPRLKRVKMAKK